MPLPFRTRVLIAKAIEDAMIGVEEGLPRYVPGQSDSSIAYCLGVTSRQVRSVRHSMFPSSHGGDKRHSRLSDLEARVVRLESELKAISGERAAGRENTILLDSVNDDPSRVRTPLIHWGNT